MSSVMHGALTTCYIIMTMLHIDSLAKLYDICHIEQIVA